ncbi:MAG: chemotaxis protein CheW [Syntrophomonas sp.]
MSADNVFSSGEMQLVTFALDKEIYGIDIMNVQEIIRIPSITVVPQAAGYVEGVTNLRGHILPVIDTRTKFGMEKIDRGVSSRVIVVDVKGKTVGLSVDAVSEVLRIESDRIEAAPAAVSGVDASSITGVVKLNDEKKLAMILDVAKICSIEQPTNSEALNFKKGLDASVKKEERKLEEVQLVSFLLGNEEFGLEIETVREIIRYPEIVKVPNVSHYIKGLISLRDTLMPIIDMRVKLDMGKDEITGSTRVVVVDLEGTLVGLIVDKVYEVTRVPKDTIFPPPGALGGDNGSRLKGIARLDGGKRIIMLMDLQDIISSEELQDIEHLEAGGAVTEEESSFDQEIEEEQMVVFRLAGEQFGVRITQVQEINRLSNITKVPRAPEYVEGVVNLRGDVIPVIDLRKRFQMESKEYNEFTRVIVSDINKKKVGLIVDEVLEVLRVPGRLLEETPDILQDNQMQRFMDGIANLEKRMIMMLNLENILVEKEWQKIAQLGKNEAKSPKTASPKLKKQGRNSSDD